MIKMIAMDMDGTALNNESKLSDYTIQVLKEIQEKESKLFCAPVEVISF